MQEGSPIILRVNKRKYLNMTKKILIKGKFNKKGQIIIAIMIACCLLINAPLSARSYIATVYDWNSTLLKLINQLRVISTNFPCNPHPSCLSTISKDSLSEGENYQKFRSIEDNYRSGYLNYMEGNYKEAYVDYAKTILGIDQLSENFADLYIERSRKLLIEALGEKNVNDVEDLTYSEILTLYTPESAKVKDIKKTREVPTTKRGYSKEDSVYYRIKREMALNFKAGFARIRHAKQSYDWGLKKEASELRRIMRYATMKSPIELSLEQDTPQATNEKDLEGTAATSQEEKLQRFLQENSENGYVMDSKITKIKWMLKSISYSRMSKINAWYSYRIKYPLDNYVLSNPYGKDQNGQTPNIEEVQMNWYENPYLYPADLNPMFDFTIPDELRRDLFDSKGEIYQDRVDIEARLKYYQEQK